MASVKERGLKGYSRLNKAELIRLLESQDGETQRYCWTNKNASWRATLLFQVFKWFRIC